MQIAESDVLRELRREPGGLTTMQIRERLGHSPSKTTSNRLAYLLRTLCTQNQVVRGADGGRTKRWVPIEPAFNPSSTLLAIHSEWDGLTMAKATPGTSTAAEHLREVAEAAVSGKPPEDADEVTAIRILVGLVPSAISDPQLIPNPVRRVLSWLEGVSFEVLDARSIYLTADYNAFFSVQ
jgi:hypothetical protein